MVWPSSSDILKQDYFKTIMVGYELLEKYLQWKIIMQIVGWTLNIQ